MLPLSGNWALGSDAQALAEQLLAEARASGKRTGWLGPEAGFVSNLSVLENLRLVHEWHARGDSFSTALQAALSGMELRQPDWLQTRPAQLSEARLRQARLLRVWLMQPDVLVLSPLAGNISETALLRLRSHFPSSLFFLLDEPAQDWPALAPHAMLDDSSGEPTA